MLRTCSVFFRVFRGPLLSWDSVARFSSGLHGCHFVEEPRTRIRPLALGGPLGNADARRGLLERQPDKEALLHQLRLARIVRRQPLESILQDDGPIVQPVWRDDEVEIALGGELDPAVIRPATSNPNSSYLAVIMPMRI